MGGGRRSGGGKGAHVFQEEQKVISRRRKDVWGGGGRLYQTDCKLTANKGGIAGVLQSLLGESGKSYSDTTKIVRSTPPPLRDDKV